MDFEYELLVDFKFVCGKVYIVKDCYSSVWYSRYKWRRIRKLLEDLVSRYKLEALGAYDSLNEATFKVRKALAAKKKLLEQYQDRVIMANSFDEKDLRNVGMTMLKTVKAQAPMLSGQKVDILVNVVPNKILVKWSNKCIRVDLIGDIMLALLWNDPVKVCVPVK